MGFYGKKWDFVSEKMEGMGFHGEKWDFVNEKTEGMGLDGENRDLCRKKHGACEIFGGKNGRNGI